MSTHAAIFLVFAEPLHLLEAACCPEERQHSSAVPDRVPVPQPEPLRLGCPLSPCERPGCSAMAQGQ